jgi:thioredoxin reductase (NADPH)
MRAGLEGRFSDGLLRVNISDGSVMQSRSNICATGVRWRRLGLNGEERFFGAGLYYGSGAGEAPQCVGEEVIVVGGANSAGQTTMHLSQYADKVTLLVRGPNISQNMSAYLVDRIATQPNVEVRTGSSISRLVGGQALSAIEARTPEGDTVELPSTRVFVCIGGEANTEWAESAAKCPKCLPNYNYAFDPVRERDLTMSGDQFWRPGSNPAGMLSPSSTLNNLSQSNPGQRRAQARCRIWT